MKTDTQINPTELDATIKLGIDAHAKWFYAARQVDGATPQPVQKLTFDALLRFVAKQQGLAREVIIDNRHLLLYPSRTRPPEGRG